MLRTSSIALPFMPWPQALQQTAYVGDCGFDPLGLATTQNLPSMREAELRHGRLAMVATWGWPIGEGGLWLAQKLVPTSEVLATGHVLQLLLQPCMLLWTTLPALSIISWPLSTLKARLTVGAERCKKALELNGACGQALRAHPS